MTPINLIEEFIKRKIADFDNAISTLEKGIDEDRSFLKEAELSKNVPMAEVEERMNLSKENLLELDWLRARRDYIKNKYLKE